MVVPRETLPDERQGNHTLLKCISLKLHSSLEAVGLTAKLSKKLTDHGISSNVIAGYFHDHIFVPSTDADRAMNALRDEGNND